jgi:hypothetical protein
MSLEIYKVFHITGLILLAMSTGVAAANHGDRSPRFGMILHGTGLLVLLIAGFGIMARLDISSPEKWPLWLSGKMIIWFFAAAMPALVKNGLVPRKLAWAVSLLLAAGAAWMALVKPF